MTDKLISAVKAKMTPAIEVVLRKNWNLVCDKLEAHYLSMTPRPKSFEVHHSNEVARKAFLTAFVDGKGEAEQIGAGLTAVGLSFDIADRLKLKQSMS